MTTKLIKIDNEYDNLNNINNENLLNMKTIIMYLKRTQMQIKIIRL